MNTAQTADNAARRMAILLALYFAPRYKLNRADLRLQVERTGDITGDDKMASEYAWLAEMELIEPLELDVVRLTARGEDVVLGCSETPRGRGMLASLADAYNKPMSAVRRIMPETDKLAVATDIVKRPADFTRIQHPKHAAAPIDSRMPSSPEAWQEPKTTNNLMMIEMPGDSMDPTIYNGEQLLIDTSVMRVRQDGIYAYAINGGVTVKRISLLHNGGLCIMSANSHYVTEQLSPDQADMINIVGRVVMRFRRM